MKKTATKTIAIRVMGANKYEGGSYIDFCISINGNEPDADLYRIYSWENEFHKVLGFTSMGHAIRGKARKVANELILKMRATGMPIGVAEM